MAFNHADFLVCTYTGDCLRNYAVRLHRLVVCTADAYDVSAFDRVYWCIRREIHDRRLPVLDNFLYMARELHTQRQQQLPQAAWMQTRCDFLKTYPIADAVY